MQLEEEKRSRAIREAELKAELELERQLREWEREQPQLPSRSQIRTQPIMATDYDGLKRNGDSQETSASPPRANISVFPPVVAQSTNFDSKAVSTAQADTCLRQFSNNLTTPLSTITKSPVTSHDTQSLVAEEILTVLPVAPHHTTGSTEVARLPQPTTNLTPLHGTVSTHMPLHSFETTTALPHSLTSNRGDADSTIVQTSPTTGLGLAAVAPATTSEPHSIPDSLTGHKSTGEIQITSSSSQHTQSPAQTSVGENKRHTPPPVVAPATQTLGTSGVMTSQPVVIVKQFQTPKPYSGQSSHKSFKEHFERVAKANGWTTEQEKMQHLAWLWKALQLNALRRYGRKSQMPIVSCGPSSLIDLAILMSRRKQ